MKRRIVRRTLRDPALWWKVLGIGMTALAMGSILDVILDATGIAPKAFQKFEWEPLLHGILALALLVAGVAIFRKPKSGRAVLLALLASCAFCLFLVYSLVVS